MAEEFSIQWWPSTGAKLTGKRKALTAVFEGLKRTFGSARSWNLTAAQVEPIEELIAGTSDSQEQGCYRDLIKAIKKHHGIRVGVEY
jgi:hypothetical protein